MVYLTIKRMIPHYKIRYNVITIIDCPFARTRQMINMNEFSATKILNLLLTLKFRIQLIFYNL